MAYSDIDFGWFEFPALSTYQAGVPSSISTTLDSSGEYIASVGPVPDAGTISHVGVGIWTVSVSGDIDVRIETVDSGGLPSGTLWAANTDATVSVTASDNYSFRWIALTSGASVSANDWIALKIRANSSSTPTISVATNYFWLTGTPYEVEDLGTPTKSAGKNPVIYAKYSDGSLMRRPAQSMVFLGSTELDLFSNSNVLGNRFKLPFDANCIGFSFTADINVDATIRLYDSDASTVLQSLTVYSAVAREAASPYPRHMLFSADQALSADTWYRIGLTGSTAATSTLYFTNQLEETTYGGAWWMDQEEGIAQVMHTEASSASPTGEGDWTNTAGQICHIGILIDQVSEYSLFGWNMRGRWRVE